jgi:predicted MFS family arabinose efflux permease
VRWLTVLGLGPLVGAASDRFGQDIAAAIAGSILLTALVGAVMLPSAGAIACLFVILLCDGALHIVMSAAATGVALTTARPHAFIGVFTTTTDAGSALGPLLAYSLVAAVGLPAVYLSGGALLAVALLRFWQESRRAAAAAR